MGDATFAHGQRVTVAGRLGTVRFCGGTKFAAGVWVGIELDDAVGKNSGTVQDVEYFRCPAEHGIFVRPPMVQPLEDSPQDVQRRASLRADVAGEGEAGPLTTGAEKSHGTGETQAEAAQEGVDEKVEKAPEEAAANTAAAHEKVAAEAVAAAEEAAAEKASGELAAAEQEAAEQAAAEKEAALKAAAEKEAAEKAAAAKAAAEKETAEKEAAERAAAEKAAAERAAAETAAADKAAAEKAEKAAAEKAAAAKVDQAKRAQEASAAQIAASKAQTAAEQELRSARQEVTRLRNDIDRTKASTSAERERLTQLKWRREQAIQQMEKLTKIDYGDVEHSEEVLQAQAEMQRAAKAAEKLRLELNQKKNNVSTMMMMIRSKLKKKVENVQDQSQLQVMLQEKLEAAVLARLMSSERLEELKLDLAEAELKQDEEAEARARLLVQIGAPGPPSGPPSPSKPGEDGAMAALMKLQNRKRKEEPPQPAPEPVEATITRSPELDAYQEALRVLHYASQAEISQLQQQIAELDRGSNKVPRLKTDQKALTNRQNLLQERMADLETEAQELAETAKTGEELLDLRDSVVHELRQEAERREERLQRLEDLVLRLDRERQRLQEEAEKDALDAKDLREEVIKLTDGDRQGDAVQVHSRLSVASVQRSLACLDLATAKAKARAFSECVPLTWREEVTTPAAESLQLALARGGCAKVVERLLMRLQIIGRRAGECVPSLRMEMCEVSSAAFRTAAAMSLALDAGLSGAQSLENPLQRAEQKLKEVMQKTWPLDSPSQALSCLQEVDSIADQLPKSTGNARAAAFQLQRFQVAFAYGIASRASFAQVEEAPPKKAQEDSAMAALMRLQNRKEASKAPENETGAAEEAAEEVAEEGGEEAFHEDQWPELELRLKNLRPGPRLALPDDVQRLGKAMEVGLKRCATGEEKEPRSFWRSLRDAAEFWRGVLPSLEAKMALTVEEPLMSSAKLAVEAPNWAESSLEVQTRIEEIDERQREVREGQERLKESQEKLALAEEEMRQAEKRGMGLKAKLSAMIEANETSESLEAEEEMLRREVAAKALSQAELFQQFNAAKNARDKLEVQHQEEEKRRRMLEDSIDKMRQRPKQDEDGRATGPELAALRLSQKKGARELYQLRVSGMEELTPLPSQSATNDDDLVKYASLRQGLLKHLSSTRIQRLGVRATEAPHDLQELHLRVSEANTLLRGEVKGEVPVSSSSRAEPTESSQAFLKLALKLQAAQAPRWAKTFPKQIHTSKWADIREIHLAACT